MELKKIEIIFGSFIILAFAMSLLFTNTKAETSLNNSQPSSAQNPLETVSEPPPFYEYQIYNDTIIEDPDIVEPVFGGYGSYAAIFEKHGVCEKVLNGEIDEVWLWAGNGDGINHGHLLEWATTGPGWDDPFFDAPDCGKVITTVTFNFTRDPNLHAFGHRLEGLFGHHVPCDLSTQTWPWNGAGHPTFADCGDLLSNSYGFVARPSSDNNFVAGCGDVHFPPNITSSDDYQYASNASATTMCPDWSQDGSATSIELSCQNWGCSEKGYLIWWMQNIPGDNNTNRDRTGAFHPNWWTFMFGGKFIEPPAPDNTPTPTSTATPTPVPILNQDELVFLPLALNPKPPAGTDLIKNHIATLPIEGETHSHLSEHDVQTAVYANDQEAVHKPVVLVIHLSAYSENGAAISPIEDQVNEIIQQIRRATTYHGYLYEPILIATFEGQDGAGYAGENCDSGTANDNIHIHLTGVQEDTPISNVRITEVGDVGVWANPCVVGSTWMIHVENSGDGERDLYFKPYRTAPEGTLYHIEIGYEDGSEQVTIVEGSAVSP